MKTILLVDDSPTFLMSMTAVLERNGYGIASARNGDEGLLRISSAASPFAMIVTDYNMPGMNGVDLVRAARKLPGARFIPILLLTTESDQKKRGEAKAAGATGWLVKPVPPDMLLQAIRQLVPGA